ncbi:MAG: hypothetical protein WBG11_01205 [Methylocella sp.]
MNNRFEVSPDFTIERGRTARNIGTVTAPADNLSPERAAFIAAILAGRSTRPPPEFSRTPGEPPCRKGK